MMRPPAHLAESPARSWFEAAARPEIDNAISAIHNEIARQTAARRPVCVQSGRCCHFEAFGHRLYVTGLETAWTLQRVARAITMDDVERARAAGTCPFLQEKLCSIHTVRPMACRIFFCDETAGEWQHELYERYHQSIIALHERYAIRYEYGEWRSMLRACVAATPAPVMRSMGQQNGNSRTPKNLLQVRIT